jgi:hypothetical protein
MTEDGIGVPLRRREIGAFSPVAGAMSPTPETRARTATSKSLASWAKRGLTSASPALTSSNSASYSPRGPKAGPIPTLSRLRLRDPLANHLVVTNRVTPTGGAKPDSGGLAMAVRSALRESGPSSSEIGRVWWFRVADSRPPGTATVRCRSGRSRGRIAGAPRPWQHSPSRRNSTTKLPQARERGRFSLGIKARPAVAP